MLLLKYNILSYKELDKQGRRQGARGKFFLVAPI
jgi:hypothetical protein